MSRFLITAVTVLVVILVVIDASGVRPSQSIGVRGFLKCNGRPAAGVLVKLYDHDSKFFVWLTGLPHYLITVFGLAPHPLRCKFISAPVFQKKTGKRAGRRLAPGSSIGPASCLKFGSSLSTFIKLLIVAKTKKTFRRGVKNLRIR